MDPVQTPIEVSQKLLKRLDVLTFSCKGKTVQVAKEAFLNACPNFKGLVSGSFKESKENVIGLERTSCDAFNSLVQFINTGMFNTDHWTSSEWKSAIALAHEYHCDKFLEELVEKLPLIQCPCKDIFHILHLAEKMDIKDLVKKSWVAIDALGDLIVANKSLFSLLPEEVVLKLVERNTFCVDEHQLLAAVLAWLEFHPAADPKLLLANIRWDQTNASLLGKATLFKPLFTSVNTELLGNSGH